MRLSTTVLVTWVITVVAAQDDQCAQIDDCIARTQEGLLGIAATSIEQLRYDVVECIKPCAMEIRGEVEKSKPAKYCKNIQSFLYDKCLKEEGVSTESSIESGSDDKTSKNKRKVAVAAARSIVLFGYIKEIIGQCPTEAAQAESCLRNLASPLSFDSLNPDTLYKGICTAKTDCSLDACLTSDDTRANQVSVCRCSFDIRTKMSKKDGKCQIVNSIPKDCDADLMPDFCEGKKPTVEEMIDELAKEEPTAFDGDESAPGPDRPVDEFKAKQNEQLKKFAERFNKKFREYQQEMLPKLQQIQAKLAADGRPIPARLTNAIADFSAGKTPFG